MIAVLVSCRVTNTSDTGKKSIVCTTFPQYDWTMNILGDKADEWNISILLDGGTDLHNFQPSAEDIITINTSDLLIYVGGGSDGWVEDVFKTNSADAELINLMQTLGDGVLERDRDYDEHVWLSLENAEEFCEVISYRLGIIDPDNAAEYNRNCDAYTEKLEALEERYEAVVDTAKHKTLVFADRYPFAYLCRDLGLTAHTAFSGCSADTEASFERMVELAAEIDGAGVSAVVVIDSSDRKLAQTVISNTKTKNLSTVELNSMQSVIAEDADYLSIMEKNLDALKIALN